MAVFTVTTLNDDNDAEVLGGTYTNGLSLREAIVLANSNAGLDSITFDPGVFAGGAGTITLTNGALVSQSDIIINGDIDSDPSTRITIDANLNSRGLLVNGSGVTTTLNNIEIVNGNEATTSGGAVSVDAGSTLIANHSAFRNSTAVGDGGGIARQGGYLELNDSEVTGNSANYGGGGIFVNGTLTLNNSTVDGNTASGSGGGLQIGSYSSATITTSTISNNAAYHGGGLHVATSSSSATISSSTINDNSASGNGGGIRMFGGVALTNVTVANNTSGADGAGLHIDATGSAVATNVTIAGNRSGAVGGGFSAQGNLTLYNSLVTRNADYFGTNDDAFGVYSAYSSIVGPSSVFSTIDPSTPSGTSGSLLRQARISVSRPLRQTAE